jgi:molecular chaperone DnaJ
VSKQDYYSLLSVEKNASQDDIKKAYRKLAMKYHPDRNQGDKEAEKKFKEINEAYEVLKDEQKRAAYDRFGHAAFENAGSGGFGGGGGGFNGQGFDDLSDIFGGIFNDFMGGGRGRAPAEEVNRGSDLRYNLTISMEDAFHGGKHQIQFRTDVKCDTCKGSGSKSGKVAKCSTCQGAGRMRMQQGFFMVERTCHTCGGTGEMIADPCGKCKGKGTVAEHRTLSVNIPSGVEEGTRMRLGGEGEAGKRGGRAGDLYIFISIKKHNLFARDGADLHCEIPIKMSTAAIGGSIEVPSIDGSKSKLTIPEGTQHGTQFRMKGKGMPIMKSGRSGDLIVHVKIEVPVNLSKKQKEILSQFDEDCGDSCTPESKSFFNKVKHFFDDLKK